MIGGHDMKAWITSFVATAGLAMATFSPCAYAVEPSFVPDLNVTINGLPPVNPAIITFTDAITHADFTYINIAGAYTVGAVPNQYILTISPKCTTGSAREQVARVEAGDDGDNDRLSLKNVRITVSAVTIPASENLIEFSGTFNNPPRTNPTTNPPLRAAYRLDGGGGTVNYIGNLMRGVQGATGDMVRGRGNLSVQNPPDSGTWVDWPIDASTSPEIRYDVTAANGNIVSKNNYYPYRIEKNYDASNSVTPLDGPRKVKGQFWFTLSNTSDLLSMPSTCAAANKDGFQVISIPAFAPPPEEKEGRAIGLPPRHTQ
jgi:hypothetical protein